MVDTRLGVAVGTVEHQRLTGDVEVRDARVRSTLLNPSRSRK